MTADELFHMSSSVGRCELVEGELHVMNLFGCEHGIVVGRLSWLLSSHVYSRAMGEVFGAETGFLIGQDPDTVLAPDIAFIRKQQLEKSRIPKTFYPAAPTLAVEVASPGDTIEEVDAKMRRWLAAGVELAWLVNPGGRTVTVYRATDDITVLTENDMLGGEQVVPDFECRIGDIFVDA